MATTKKTSSKTEPTPTIRVEYDYGTNGERRIKEFPDAAKANKFIKLKARAGKNPKELKAPPNAKTKPKFKVTAVTEVDLDPAAATTTAKTDRETTKAASPKTSTVPGVRPMRTRPYLAGKIIAKHGVAAGVTDAMVAELDEAYGKPNATESRWCLKNAWHAARGFAGIAEDAIG